MLCVSVRVCVCRRGWLEPGGLRPYLGRFLSWVVKVTYGASSRVQGLGEKTCGPALPSPLSYVPVNVPPCSLLPKSRKGGRGWQEGTFLRQCKWLRPGFQSRLYQ